MSLGAKLQPIIIIFSALLGIVLGRFTTLSNVSTGYIELFLMILLYILFICIDLKEIGQAFVNVRYTLTTVIINFMITPIVAFILGQIFFANSIEIRIGLLMLLVTPCTDWYLVFTGLSRGNVGLNISILPINLILQIVLMPIYLYVFLGSEIQINTIDILQSVLMVLLIPFTLSLITKAVLKNKDSAKKWINDKSDNLQLLFLCLAVIVMFASESNNLFENSGLLITLFLPLVIFFILILTMGQIVGRLLKFSKKDIIALNFTTLARNSPLSLAIAVAAFPELPLVSLALVIGPLIELPILSIISNVLLKWNDPK